MPLIWSQLICVLRFRVENKFQMDILFLISCLWPPQVPFEMMGAVQDEAGRKTDGVWRGIFVVGMVWHGRSLRFFFDLGVSQSGLKTLVLMRGHQGFPRWFISSSLLPSRAVVASPGMASCWNAGRWTGWNPKRGRQYHRTALLSVFAAQFFLLESQRQHFSRLSKVSVPVRRTKSAS